MALKPRLDSGRDDDDYIELQNLLCDARILT